MIIALIAMCVTAILIAAQTPIVATDAGRVLLVAFVALMVVCSPVADGVPIIDRLIAATIGGYALHVILRIAWGPVPYRMIKAPPLALLEARSTAYKIRCNVRRVAFV